MPERSLSLSEAKNLENLNACYVESAPLFVTGTGLTKSICDATAPIRKFFFAKGIHDYASQSQGQGNKRFVPVQLVTNTGLSQTKMSLYRPETKQGDPRLWVCGLQKYAKAEEALVFFVHDKKLCLFNLTEGDSSAPAVMSFFDAVKREAGSVVMELLGRLREIAQHPIPAVCQGDTAVGRSVESALGIAMNSSKKPDYKGIELKAKREKSMTKDVLFAQVPDWEVSPLKSFREMLDRFGYYRGEKFCLHCTVSSLKPNSQNLILGVDDVKEFLNESCRIPSKADEKLLVWRMETLEHRLVEKHADTFWIDVRSEKINDQEVFHLESVLHTSRPNVPQFERLIESGDITVDHLIKRITLTNVKEHGPLFKIKKDKVPQLFLGRPETFRLV